MYVELYGKNSQVDGYPAKVYLRLRHMPASYFRDGNGKTKEFQVLLGKMRKFQFNRFGITDADKCNEAKKNGDS